MRGTVAKRLRRERIEKGLSKRQYRRLKRQHRESRKS